LLAVLSASCKRSRGEQAAPPPEVVAISATELWSRYRENNLGAEAMYAGADLRVTGTVTGIELGGTDRPVVLLAGGSGSQPVRAEMAPDVHARAAMLSEGDQVVLRCRGVTELVEAPMLRNCEF
jgi:20S proteasome alpha/beta subunit